MTKDVNAERAGALDCATLSDAMDRLGLRGQCERIHGRSEEFQMTGRAYTVRYGPASKPAGTVGDYIDDVPRGAIVVLDNGGREDVTVWGDILTEVAHRRGIAGTLIDGVCRDVALCRRLGYPVFSRGNWMRTGKDRVQVETIGETVAIGSVRVAPGDLVRADADGVVILPTAHESAILDTAEEICRAEDAIRARTSAGVRLDDARREYGYHRLQSAKERV